MNKFKVGDKVENHIGVVFRVLKVMTVVSPGGRSFDYRLEHWNKDPVLGEITISENYLSFSYETMHKTKPIVTNVGDNCPVCQTPWQKSSFGMKRWRDCIPCGKTAEDILEAQSNKQSEVIDESSKIVDDEDFGYYYGMKITPPFGSGRL